MKITGADLAELAKHLPGLAVFAKWTPTTIDDVIVTVLTMIGQDRELLDQLAEWLNWLPFFDGAYEAGFEIENPEPALPSCIAGYRPGLEGWRAYLRIKHGDQ